MSVFDKNKSYQLKFYLNFFSGALSSLPSLLNTCTQNLPKHISGVYYVSQKLEIIHKIKRQGEEMRLTCQYHFFPLGLFAFHIINFSSLKFLSLSNSSLLFSFVSSIFSPFLYLQDEVIRNIIHPFIYVLIL